MNNPGIDPALFGEPFYEVAEGPSDGKPCLPIPCPSGPPATAEETARWLAARDMKARILTALDAWADGCLCADDLRDVIRRIEP